MTNRLYNTARWKASAQRESNPECLRQQRNHGQ